MQFEHPLDALDQFELLRFVIGHTALADNMAQLRRRWEELDGDPDQLQLVLAEYHDQVAGAADLTQNPSRHPVIPVVEASYGLVRYTTISGSTDFMVDLRERTLTMTRPGAAIPIGLGERCAMAILTGFLGNGTEEREVGHVADPRPSARRHLTRMVGKVRADKLIAAYGQPLWRAWQLEYEVAKLEAALHNLRLERTQLHHALGVAKLD